MEINIVWIVVVILLIAGGIAGYRRGLVDGVIRIISFFVGILVLMIIMKGVGNFLHGSYVNVLMALILLLAVKIINKLIHLVLDSLKLVSNLPVVSWLDRLAGAILGITKTVFVIWILFILFGVFDILNLKTWIEYQVNASAFLKLLYHSNYIVHLLKGV